MSAESMRTRKTNPDERAIAEIAAKSMKHADRGVEPGKALPDDFENPPPGEPDHLCLDLRGRYAPTWSQLMIIKTDQVGREQYFNDGGHPYKVRVGEWADVPPTIVNNIQNCMVEEVILDFDKQATLVQDSATKTVKKIPRFNYRIMPSA